MNAGILAPKVKEMRKEAQATTRRNDSRAPKDDSRVPGKTQNDEDENDLRDARRALEEARKKGSIPWEQVKREVGI